MNYYYLNQGQSSEGARHESETESTGGQDELVRCLNGDQAARLLDKFSRVAFPTAFVAFNIIYWSVYLG